MCEQDIADPGSDMIDSQRDVERFMRKHGLRYDAATHVLDLVSEVGELAKLFLQASGYGRQPVSWHGDFSGEMGDILYSVLTLATVLEVDAGEALADVLKKYERRLIEHGGPGSA